MKYSALTLMLAAFVAGCPVYAQASSRGNKDASAQTEAKTGVRFVICSATQLDVDSPFKKSLWYKVNDEEAKQLSISARTASPRVKPVGGKILFYEDNPIPPKAAPGNKDAEKEAKKWKAPKVVFELETAGAASKSFCIIKPKSGDKADAILLDEKDFPKKGMHLINLSSCNVEISISKKGDFSDAEKTRLAGGTLNKVVAGNKWSLKGAEHGENLAFSLSYETEKEERAADAKGRTIKDKNGTAVKKKVKKYVPLRRSRFVVSERQSVITIIVDDAKGVKMLSVQLAD